jgi:hypothetical protein
MRKPNADEEVFIVLSDCTCNCYRCHHNNILCFGKLQAPPPAAPSRVVQFVLGVVPSLIVGALVLIIADDDLSKFSVDRLHFSSRQLVYLCDARKQTYET